MTIEFSNDWQGFKAGQTRTLDAATEAAAIGARVARSVTAAPAPPVAVTAQATTPGGTPDQLLAGGVPIGAVSGAGNLDYFPIAAFFPGWATTKPAGGPLAPTPSWSLIPDNRVPLIGKFDDAQQVWCDYQLELMRDYGIKGVAVEVFFQNGTIDPVYDYWLSLYQASTVANKPKLMLMWVANTNQGIYSSANWSTVIQRFLPYFRDANYLKIDGKPAWAVFDVPTMQTIMTNDVGVKTAIAALRTACAEFGGVFTVGFVNNATSYWMGTVSTAQAGAWDAITCYTNFFRYQNGQDTAQSYSAGESTYSNRFSKAVYGTDAAGTQAGQTGLTFHSWFGNSGYPKPPVFNQPALTSNGWAGTTVPELWVPVNTGWAPKPWDGASTDDANPADAEFELQCLDARSSADAYRETKCKHGVVFISAWNELGEGQYIIPTKGTGYGRLEVIRKIFGKR